MREERGAARVRHRVERRQKHASVPHAEMAALARAVLVVEVLPRHLALSLCVALRRQGQPPQRIGVAFLHEQRKIDLGDAHGDVLQTTAGVPEQPIVIVAVTSLNPE